MEVMNLKDKNDVKALLKQAPAVYETGFPIREFLVYDKGYVVMLGVSRPQEDDYNSRNLICLDREFQLVWRVQSWKEIYPNTIRSDYFVNFIPEESDDLYIAARTVWGIVCRINVNQGVIYEVLRHER